MKRLDAEWLEVSGMAVLAEVGAVETPTEAFDDEDAEDGDDEEDDEETAGMRWFGEVGGRGLTRWK